MKMQNPDYDSMIIKSRSLASSELFRENFKPQEIGSWVYCKILLETKLDCAFNALLFKAIVGNNLISAFDERLYKP